jgi:hypothetical protein
MRCSGGSSIEDFVRQYLTCDRDDETCNEFLPQLRSNYPAEFHQAEFQCAMKNGSLFFSVEETEVELRCGFMATTVWDENSDGEIDYEDPVSVDISVGRFPLNP